jgi:DNA-binding CsgD family transcriptional regulator
MDAYSDIIKKRALAGVMILNADKELLYVNEEARRFLHAMLEEEQTQDDPPSDMPATLPRVVDELCTELISNMHGEKNHARPFIYKNVTCLGDEYFLRAIPIHRISKEKEPSHIMVTVERFSTRLRVDIKKVGTKFGLTKRETEVLKGLARGMTNRDISGLLFISEHTVKDHVRSLMQKIGVNNRSLLICRIFENNR